MYHETSKESRISKAMLNVLLSKYSAGRLKAHENEISAFLLAIEAIGHDPPFCYIKNQSAVNEALRNTPFWIAYGGPRTGSTFVFLTLKALMDSAISYGIYCWEGDFASPEKFFNLIEADDYDKSGVLKIHRRDEPTENRLKAGTAKAFMSIRDYPSIAKSYWRMKHNKLSPFYTPSPSIEDLESIIRKDIENEIAKRELPMITLIREDTIRSSPVSAIIQIAESLQINLHQRSATGLAKALSFQNLAKRTKRARINSTGHDKSTFLHVGHISTTQDQDPEGSQDVTDMVLQKFSNFLGQDGYLLPREQSATQ